MGSPRLTPKMIRGLPKAGATDPIEYYSRPVIGRLFRDRINLGLAMLPPRVFENALEIGYGAGAVQLALHGVVKELHGLDLDADPSAVGSALASRGVTSTLVKGSVYELPYPDETFELVVSFSVFEHLDEPMRALAEVARVLKGSSYFLLGMPAVSRFMQAAFTAIGFSGIDQHHVTAPRDVEERFHEAGLRVLGENNLYVPPRLPLVPSLVPPLYHNWLLVRLRPPR